MATLPYSPEEVLTKNAKPELNEMRLGDGYEVVSPKGLNHDLKVWNVQWVEKPEADIESLDAFFTAHGGWQSFEWTPRGEPQPKKFRCKSWTRTYNHDVVVQSMVATFTEVRA